MINDRLEATRNFAPLFSVNVSSTVQPDLSKLRIGKNENQINEPQSSIGHFLEIAKRFFHGRMCEKRVGWSLSRSPDQNFCRMPKERCF
jgi:hypothetical protein